MIKYKPIWIRIIVLLFVLFLPAQIVFAQFPEREDTQVVDPNQYFETTGLTRFNEQLAQFPHEYIVVFLDQIEGNAEEYSQQLFEHYQLESDSVLFVITVADQNQLYYAYGQQLREQGLTNEIIDSRISTMYQHYADQQNYFTGVHSLIQAIERELTNITAQRERDAALSVNDQTEALQAATASPGLPWWIVMLLIVIFSLTCFILFSFMYRKKILRDVDRLEAWKIQLENRPFSSQLSRVKGLKMAGETEERFEKWRGKWENILTNSLPDIEETLIDIEDYTDHYRFIKASQLLRDMEQQLKDIELELDQIVAEIDELTSSEKQNREKITFLHEQYQEIKSALHKQSVSLGISYPVWVEKFRKTTTWFDSFEAAQQNGDYLSAQDFVLAIEEIFQQIKEALERSPGYIQQIEHEIPKQMDELSQAIAEMSEKGYILKHTNVEERLDELKKKQLEVVSYMQNGLIKEMKAWISETKTEMEALFAVLEEEVKSKQFVISNVEVLPTLIEELKNSYGKLVESVQITKASYSWEKEWEEELNQITTLYKELNRNGEVIQQLEAEVEEKYPLVKKELQSFFEQHDQFKLKLQAFENTINKLREDELKAKETAVQLKQSLVKLRSILRKSNLPGIPEHLNAGLAMADESIQELQTQLQQQKLDLPRVLHVLKETKSQVESVTQVTKSVIQQAHKAEQYIQYGNRYRRYDLHVDEILQEAEHAFRRAQYREALDYAEAALDKADRQWRDVFSAEDLTGS